jgi:hypothetical protein
LVRQAGLCIQGADQVNVDRHAEAVRRLRIGRGDEIAGAGDQHVDGANLADRAVERTPDRVERGDADNVAADAAMAAPAFSCLRLATDTFAPCSEKFWATPKPVPAVPPKTSVCFPVKSNVSAVVTAPFFETWSRVH